MTTGRAIDEIDLGFVPSPVPPQLEIEVGPELVLMGGRDARTHALNPTAALIWECLDGSSTLGEVADELSAATGAPLEVVGGDVVAVARRFAELGLLDGFEPDGEDGQWEPAGPIPLEIGAALDDFSMPDLDGTTTSLSQLLAAGERLLLVNWSPGCGFCLAIGPDLASLQDPLRQEGVSMALVSTGGADHNRSVLAASGLDVPLLLRQEDLSPFPGFGTPAAYLLDLDGTVLAPMAYGAIDVPALARSLAGESTEPSGAPDSAGGDGPAPQYLPGPVAACGPGTSAGGTSTEWTGTAAFALPQAAGDVRYVVRVGIRHNDGARVVLDGLFPGLAIDDPRVIDNYSVVIHPSDTGRRRELNLLVRGGQQLVRSRSAARVLRGLLGYLSAEMARSDPRLLRVSTTPAVRDGKAILLPPGLTTALVRLQSRLARLRIQLVDLPRTTLDTDTNELVVPEPELPYDRSLLENLDAQEAAGDSSPGSELPAVLPGRYPVSTWYMAIAPAVLGPLREAVALASGLPLVARGEDSEVAAGLHRVLQAIEGVGVWYENPEQLLGQLA